MRDRKSEKNERTKRARVNMKYVTRRNDDKLEGERMRERMMLRNNHITGTDILGQ